MTDHFSLPEGQAIKIEELNKILEVARALASVQDLDEILELIISSACSLLKADRASVFLIDEKTDELFIRVATGDEMSEIRFPRDKGIAGHVATMGDTLNIEDAYQDSRFNQDVDKKTGYKTKAMLTMPLDTGEKIVGVLQTINKIDEGRFGDYDESVMSALASQAAVSIHNFWLVQEYLEKQEMQASLGIARSIQKSFLPAQAPVMPGLSVSAFSESCDEVGGDYYDYFKIDNNKVIVVIGDVTGHGVGSAMLMATARSTLHALWQKEHDPQVLLESLNDLVEKDMGDDRFITIFLGVFDMSRNQITYSSAGHDAPILYRPSEDLFVELDSTGIPLGMMEGMDYPNKSVFCKPGDVLYLMTDGVWEAMDEAQETYGRERLFDFIKRHKADSPEKICRELVADVTQFCGEAPQRDDITLLTVGVQMQPGPLKIRRESKLENLDELLWEVEFDSDSQEKNKILEELMNQLQSRQLIDDAAAMKVRLCLDEAFVNAVVHGNGSDSNKKVKVHLSCDEDYWSVVVQDEGEGFVDHQVPNPDDPHSLELEHGRGVLIMIESMDSVCYNDSGNALQMIRRIPKVVQDGENYEQKSDTDSNS